MIKHNIKTISDLKRKLRDKCWLKCHSSDMKEIKSIYECQDIFEIYKFILIGEKLQDFID